MIKSVPLDISLCRAVFGEEYESDPQYQEMVEEVKKGRYASYFNQEMREQIQHKKKGVKKPNDHRTGW